MVVTDTAPQSLLDQVHSYLPDDKADLIQKAYYFAEECHRGQMRMSGEPYIAHPLEAANFLAGLKLDADTIMAALLHDVIEDCEITYDEIKDSFGEPVAKLVDGVTKLTRMDYRLPGDTTSDQPDSDLLYAESLRKMLVAMAEDIRVVLIKLADRLHNMQTLDALPVEKRKRIAQETLDIYSPLAHRLGIWEIKWRLDDLAFRHLNEPEYRSISKMLSTRRVEREAYVDRVCSRLITDLGAFDLKAEVSGRPKGIYSIHQKINKYESLHTAIIGPNKRPIEIQLRTMQMHEFAERGIASHWKYKSSEKFNSLTWKEYDWLKDLVDIMDRNENPEHFFEYTKLQKPSEWPTRAGRGSTCFLGYRVGTLSQISRPRLPENPT